MILCDTDVIIEYIKLDGFVKSLSTCHCEERSDEAIS